jgi:hypothetical protein
MATNDGGFIGQDGLNAPDSPTGVSATAGDTEATISFTAPSDVGGSAITGFRVQDGTNAHGASGASSPITVTGLTNGTGYTFNVWAINAFGYSAPSDASGSVTPEVPEQAFIVAGYNSGALQQIDVITITSTGNATDFGDFYSAEYVGGCCSSSTRGLVGGGDTTSTDIDYFTMSSGGTTSNFGTLNQQVGGGVAGASNSTRGLFLGGFYSSGGNVWANNIQYVTIASLGNAADFGNLTLGRSQTTATSNSTRAICAGGTEGVANKTNVMDYVTIASTGNATDFGNLLTATRRQAGAASSTRAVFAGGTTSGSNVIQYVTIASTGNATDFGDLTVARQELGGTSGTTRSVFCGGGGGTNIIDYITTASTGNATDFGDLAQAREQATQTTSNSHAGLS